MLAVCQVLAVVLKFSTLLEEGREERGPQSRQGRKKRLRSPNIREWGRCNNYSQMRMPWWEDVGGLSQRPKCLCRGDIVSPRTKTKGQSEHHRAAGNREDT